MKVKLLSLISLLLLSNQIIYSQYAGKYENEKQLSLDGKYNIYRHDIGYLLMSDEKFEGTRLLEKNEDRNKNKGFDLRGLIDSWKSHDTLQVYRFDKALDKYKDTICRISFEKYYDLVVKVKTYHSLDEYGYREFNFKNLKLLKDMIVIEGIDYALTSIREERLSEVFGENLPKNASSRSFPLGGVKFKIKDGKIVNIMVSIVKTRFDYEKEMEPGKYSKEKRASIEYMNVYFYPKKSIKIDTTNLRGVFLDIK